MEKYRFYHDAETYVAHKISEAVAQQWTSEHEQEAIFALRQFISRPGIISKAMIKEALEDIETKEAQSPADKLFSDALRRIRDTGVKEKVAFYVAMKGYIANAVSQSRSRILSDTQKQEILVTIRASASRPGPVTKGMMHRKVQEIHSMHTPAYQDLLLAGALEYAEANHPRAIRSVRTR